MVSGTLLLALLVNSVHLSAALVPPKRAAGLFRRGHAPSSKERHDCPTHPSWRSRALLGAVPPGGSNGKDVAAVDNGWKQNSAAILGYLITAGACITKVPQIKRILVADSVDGISLTSNYLETISLTNKLLYHKLNKLPISTWLENVALLAQQAVIIGLIWRLSVPAISPAHMAIVVAAQSLYCLGALALPEKAWPLLLAFKTAATILSGGSQIRLNFINHSCGNLAWSPVLLRIFGNTARMVTTLVLAKKDLALLSLYATSAAIQITLGVQFWVYR